ncbi:hypothetical protein SDC9_204109 [bioreactor metagenome]|uniref:Uncharacterized protein n=1 Tax=bioreactor metagenome TaxID=1076179 RepID=A0A645IYL6_9ZZZZ
MLLCKVFRIIARGQQQAIFTIGSQHFNFDLDAVKQSRQTLRFYNTACTKNGYAPDNAKIGVKGF